jgi:hypothetical protein
VSSFLQNLAKRAAGLPLSPEYPPKPSPVVETRSGSTDTLEEIATETASEDRVEAPPTAQLQPVDAISASPTPDVQRSPSIAASTPPRQPLPQPPTVFPPSSTESAPLPPPDATAVRHEDKPARTHESTAVRQDLGEHAAPIQARRVEPHRDAGSVGENMKRESPNGQTVLRPLAAARAFGAENQGTRDAPSAHEVIQAPNPIIPPADQVIRPALTEPQIPKQFPKITPAPRPSLSTVPIHVRVGRVEVRGTPPTPTRASAKPSEQTPLGFDGYQRVRRYRN